MEEKANIFFLILITISATKYNIFHNNPVNLIICPSFQKLGEIVPLRLPITIQIPAMVFFPHPISLHFLPRHSVEKSSSDLDYSSRQITNTNNLTPCFVAPSRSSTAQTTVLSPHQHYFSPPLTAEKKRENKDQIDLTITCLLAIAKDHGQPKAAS